MSSTRTVRELAIERSRCQEKARRLRQAMEVIRETDITDASELAIWLEEAAEYWEDRERDAIDAIVASFGTLDPRHSRSAEGYVR